MCIIHGKTTHLVRLTKPKQAYLQSPAGSGQPTHKSQQLENTWTCQPNFSNNWTVGAPSHQVPTCLIRSENRHMSTRGWILSPQVEIPSFLKWHKTEDDVTESWESFNQLLLLSLSTHSIKNPKLPWPDQWSSWNNTKSAHFQTKNMYSLVHEPHMNLKWGNLGKCGLEGTKGIPTEFLVRAPRLTSSLEWSNLL